MASIRKNIVFNLINTITSIIFPIITLPYVFRILLPEGIGLIDFLNSIIGYIVLITSLGIPIYAVKEVAKHREDSLMMQKTTLEIIILNFILCFIGYFIVFLVSNFMPQVIEHKTIFFILSLSIFFNAIGVYWFYQALEDFSYITIRAIIIRILSLAAIFIFVKDKTDLIVYSFIVVSSTVGNNLLNFLRLRKYINFPINTLLKDINVKKHIKPSLELFVLNLIISIYVNLDVIMLGLMKGNEAVGYYSSAIKFYRVVLTVVTSLGVVLLPRMSNIYHNNNNTEFERLSRKSLNFTFFTAIPLTLALILLAKPIILIFAGHMYIPSIKTLQILSPIIILAGITNVFGIQILYPMGKQRLVIYSVLMGAIINLVFNFILIPKYSFLGAAISTLMAEIIVFIIQSYYIKRELNFSIKIEQISNFLFAGIMMSITILLLLILKFNDTIFLISSCIMGSITYLLYLYVVKNDFFLEILNSIIKNRNKE